MVSSAASPSEGPDTLLARPPTPPRERPADLDAKLTLDRHPVASRLKLQTPPSHSPALSTNGSSRRSRKRVEFTVQTELRDSAADAGNENENDQKHATPRSVPSSVARSIPLKSILKPSPSPNPHSSLDPSAADDEPGGAVTLAVMLESSIKHLASNDRDCNVDAYTMLVRALKTSTNLPDRIALQSKMSLFLQFIQRDITPKGENGALDASLVKHALGLLSTFLHFPAIATAVTSEFAVFIVDHCIRSFEDPTTPKDVARHLMQVVHSQDFPPKVMTADRVGRLVASLHNIENHIKGKSIIMSRILIYRRLVKQSTTHMVSHSDWLLDLFTDMLSSLKEIRAAAITLGLEVSFTAAKEKQLPKRVMVILETSADKTQYADYYIERLTAMSKERSEMASVPQIWSVVVLLLRCPIDRWSRFDPWMRIIQKCFNSSDMQTKIEANYAWDRLVYALHLHESSFSKTFSTLCSPFDQQWKRKGKQPDDLRKVVIGGLCNLLYYAFKPNSSSNHIDHYWDACVRTLIQSMALSEINTKSAEEQPGPSPDNLSQAANILAGLFDSYSGRIWKEDRIAESTLAAPSDLPALDPKWIRRNTMRVFSVVDPIIDKAFLNLAYPTSSASKLWKVLVGAVAAAASREIKVSAETAAFIGNALGLLSRIWIAGPRNRTSPDSEPLFLKATENYVTTMVLGIGQLPFTEKLLIMDQDKSLIPVATPSHRSGKGRGATRSPLNHMFSILSLLPQGIADGEGVSNSFKTIFEPFALARSAQGKKNLAQELTQLPPLDGPANHGPWVFVAEALSTAGDYSQSSLSSTDSMSRTPIGQEYRNIVKHLHKGLHLPSCLWPYWKSLFNSAIEQVTELSGEPGCSVAVIEPLAKASLERLTPETEITIGLYQCGIQLICNARHPRDRQAVDAAKCRLWGTTVAGPKSSSLDPFDSLYQLISRLLSASYMSVDSVDEDTLASLITGVTQFLARANPVLVFKSLSQLQEGLSPWIQDANEYYGSQHRSKLAEEVKLLWDRICSLFSETPLQNPQLDAIEQLLCSAFRSKHRHIVNTAMVLWNQGFGNAVEVQYPETLKTALLTLRPFVDIVLPGLDVPMSDVVDSRPVFVESQNDLEVETSGISARVTRSSSRLFSPHNSLETPRPKKTSQAGHSSPHGPETRSRTHSARSTRSTRSAKLSTKSKLRHDDSQIQFAAIEDSSPSSCAQQSQVLTDRQKEVRERQQENAAIFPSLQLHPGLEESSSTKISRQPSPLKKDAIQSPSAHQSATPKANRNYDYVSLTPTPRRGQHIMIDEDHEMTDDVPSSPPEPRRNLLPEMKSHSRDTHMLDDMPISSSPISGSPISKISLKPQGSQLVSQTGIHGRGLDILSTHKVDAKLDENIETIISEPKTNLEAPENSKPQTFIGLETSTTQGPPVSATNILVDELTGPVSQISPAVDKLTSEFVQSDKIDVKDHSFEISEGEERTMARLVIELGSRKCDPLPYYGSSPEKMQKERDPTESITVHTGSEKKRSRLGKSSRSPSLALATSSPIESDDSESSGRMLKKRKRYLDRKHSFRDKRRKHGVAMHGPDGIAILDGRASMPDQDNESSVLDLGPIEADGSMESESGGLAEEHSFALSQGSPDLSFNPENHPVSEPPDLDSDGMDSDGMDSDTAAVNLQLITEASQQSEIDHEDFVDNISCASSDPGEAEVEVNPMCAEPTESIEIKSEVPDNAEENRPPEVQPSLVERITASLKDSLEGLRNATLSREDVYNIEGMFMDIKKELYEAERRSRQ
ncbi:Rap1-interacting factor 1 N terminal-domain-containing protein [Astrocystis sublimbata]|nr:Rap1-interacting factor 1 N terminal-domain-containing protein [Astrocystis sublimbata]